MIRRMLVLLSLILLVAFLPLHVHATSDKAFTTLRLNKFGSVVIVLGTKFGFDIGGLISPFFTKLGDIAVPDFKPTADWLSGAKGFITPQQYSDDGKHINWDAGANPIFYTALYGAILKTEAPHGTKEISPECIISTGNEKSDDLPQDANDNFQRAREYDGWLGINPVDPDDNGIVDFNLPPVQLAGMNSAEDCKKHELGFEQPPVEHDIRSFSQFAGNGTKIEGQELTTIMKIVEFFNRLTGETELREEPETEMHKDDVILTKDVKQPYHSIQCHHGGCPGNESGEYSGKSSETGGWTAFLLREEDKKPFMSSSVQPYKIKIVAFEQKPGDFSYDVKNISDRRTEQAACYVVPDTSNTTQGDAQAKAAIGGNKDRRIDPMCKPTPPICDGAPPVFKGSSQCNQCSPNMSGWAEAGTVPGNKLPENLIKMVEEVGQAFGVPPASILAAMYHEGAFVGTQLDPGLYQSGPFTGADNWTDANVIKWSTCGQTMPNCPLEGNTFKECNIDGGGGEQCTKAIVGTGVMPKWFWGNGGDSDIWNAVQKIDPTRTQEAISPCNLLDSVAALGKALSIWGLYPRTPAQCYGYNMTSASAGTCSPSSWSDDKIVQSHVGMWVGSLPFCPDGTMAPPPEFGSNSTDPGYATSKVLNPYNAFSCK